MKKSIREAVEIQSLDVFALGTVTKGLRVVHPIFGAGTVVSLFEFPPHSTTRHSIGVQFETVGFKALAPEYANLRRP
jgi:hypothetical protein